MHAHTHTHTHTQTHIPRPQDLQSPPPHIRQHTSAYVSMRQHTSAYDSMRQHTSAYDSIRQHTTAYAPRHRRQDSFEGREQAAAVFVLLCQQLRQYLYLCTEGRTASREESFLSSTTNIAYVSIRQHTSAYVSIRQHRRQDSFEGRELVEHNKYSIRQHTSASVSIRQHLSAPKAGQLRGKRSCRAQLAKSEAPLLSSAP